MPRAQIPRLIIVFIQPHLTTAFDRASFSFFIADAAAATVTAIATADKIINS